MSLFSVNRLVHWFGLYLFLHGQQFSCSIEALEKVQKELPKILPQLKNMMNYSDRLKACKLPTLHYRRIRRDMIETYKIMTGKYDIEIAPSLVGVCSSITRGHSLRLQKNRTKYDLCKFFLLIE